MRILLLLALLIVGAGCVNTSEENYHVIEHEPLQHVIQLEKEKIDLDEPKLSFDEIMHVVNHNLDGMVREMEGLQEEYSEWNSKDWMIEANPEEKNFANALKITEEVLSRYVTQDQLKVMAYNYTLQAFVVHGGFIYILPEDIHARVKVINQSQDSFKIEYITLTDETEFTPAGTRSLEYQKEDGQWKLAGTKYQDVKRKPLNLTQEDLEEYYGQYLSVDRVEHQGDAYFIVQKSSGKYEAVNIKDSSRNDRVVDQYLREAEQNQQNNA